MNSRIRNRVVAAVGTALLLLVVAVIMIPNKAPLQQSHAVPNAPREVRLTGVVYDFASDHPDFNVIPAGGNGHYAGNVAKQLNADDRPVYIGLGDADGGGAVEVEPPPFAGPLGYDEAFPATQGEVEKNQIATRVTLPQGVTVTSMTALVGNKDKNVRYAIYTDSGGEPGNLITETAKVKSAQTMEWLTIDLPDTPLVPGAYWFALAFEEKNQQYAYAGFGGAMRILDHDAVGDGFLTSWGSSDTSNNHRISIYASFNSDSGGAGGTDVVGYENVLDTPTTQLDKQQIATRVTLPEDGTLLSVTAYVGNKDKEVRYAVYEDAGGNPGALIAETFSEETAANMQWLTLYLPDTPLVAGTYWIAAALEDKNHQLVLSPSGGTTRYREHDAVGDGFLNDWGGSDGATNERVSLYATYSTGADENDLVQNIVGYKVSSQWRDAESRPIAPHLYGTGSDGVIEFEIVDQGVIPTEEFAVQVMVLGAAIQTGSSGYHRPVTSQIHVGASTFEPFGGFNEAVTGNLNDIQDVTCNSNGSNPRSQALTGTFPPGTVISVDGRSWKQDTGSTCNNSGWDVKMAASTLDVGPQVKVLRDGDPVPDIDGLYDQDSVAAYVSDYIDESTNTMSLGVNEIIYLFELGEPGTSSSADFQDLVVVITLADDPSNFGSTFTLCGDTMADSEGAAANVDGGGGITSTDTFAQWYHTVLGVNISVPHSITLVEGADGVFEYSTDAFHPIDDQGFGNEGAPHNAYFTYAVSAEFDFHQCGGEFFEFGGSDDAWLFIDGQLVMDRGGVIPGTSQHVQLDRLGLANGQTYELQFFYAQRQNSDATFNIRTNLDLIGESQVPVAIGYD